MNFAPACADCVLHDTWVYTEGKEVHLFYLAPQIADPMHRLIGHAVSSDWLHWEELPFIELTGGEGAWDSGRIGTGFTFRHTDGRYYMAYTGRIDPQEDIGLAVSDDLICWEKVSVDGPVWAQARRAPYDAKAVECGLAPAWRDPFVVRMSDGTWAGYATARIEDGSVRDKACVARCRIDAMDAPWTTLAPMAGGCQAIMEVPEIFEFAGHWWLTFNTHSGWGKRLDTPSRSVAAGTFYMVSEMPEGPWQTPTDGLLIGAGGGRRDAVVARSVLYGGERLVYHHYDGSMAADSARSLGLPKALDYTDGRLVLRPWQGLRGIQTGALSLTGWRPAGAAVWDAGEWDVSEPISGQCLAGAAAQAARLPQGDVDVTCVVSIDAGERVGIAVADFPDVAGGVFVTLDAGRGEIAIGHLARGTYGPLLDNALDRVTCPVERGVDYSLRLLRRDRFAELYIDDELIFSTVCGVRSPEQPGLALIVDNASARFEAGHAFELECF